MHKGKRRGRFLVLDGPDGAGKSTQARLLSERLEACGIQVLLLREPGGSSVGEAIRKLLLEHRAVDLYPLTEAFLFQAARAQLVREVIEPALKSGRWIICDRFTLSTLVYQGLAGGLSSAVVDKLSSIAVTGITPDKYIVLWVPVGIGVRRRAGRQADRMESKGTAFMRNVARAYLKEAKKHPVRYRLVDGSGTLDEVRGRIWRHVEPLLS